MEVTTSFIEYEMNIKTIELLSSRMNFLSLLTKYYD